MDEPPSPLLKSRIPKKTTVLADANPDPDWESLINDAHCPLRKGIICYHRHGTIFEHNIHSSGKHEPRIIVPKYPSWGLKNVSFVPIKANRILLFAKYTAGVQGARRYYLHLSIHEIRSDHRVGSALWSFNGPVDGHLINLDLELTKSTDNALGIAFWARFDDHFKLFNISTTQTDTLNDFPLIESGRIGCDLELKLRSPWIDWSPVILYPDMRILLNTVMKNGLYNERIEIHYLDSGGTNFSFVTRLSVPVTEKPRADPPDFAFSADGSKFAMGMDGCGVSVWDTRSKVPLQTFTESPRLKGRPWPKRYLQFSSGNSGKELLVFVEHDTDSNFEIIRVIDATSFETEEKLVLKYGSHPVHALFFDPGERTLYAELDGTIYEWDLRKKEPGPEWWIGEE